MRPIGLVSLLCLGACALAPSGGVGDDVELRYTGFGVAHIKSNGFEGVGYGYGVAVARDNLCAIAERMITIAGERSRHLSPDEGYVDLFAGGRISNVDSDAAYLYLLSPQTVSQVKSAASPEMKALVRGYAAGFNLHIVAEEAPGEDCRKQPWFRTMTEDDVWRRIAHIPLLETTAGVLRELAAAEPPAMKSAKGSAEALEWTDREQGLHGASNAVAFGSEGVAGGVGGMSFANPHYAWHGTERLHAFHMTVPGALDVFGATALGLPFPMLGFSADVGWGITHTTDRRSTLYELTLDPADPTRYMVDGVSLGMTRVPVSVPTSQGAIERTFWETDFGTVIEGARLPWDSKLAYAFADPQRQNTAFADQFLAIAAASSVRKIKQELDAHLGSPWSNVTAADRAGEVLYANISVAANVTDSQLDDCLVEGPARAFMDIADVTVLDGARSACAWTRDPRSARPGIIPAELRPSTIRRDVVWNSNDSHWFATLSPTGRLTGFPNVIGPEQTIRGERTRMAAILAHEMMEASSADGIRGATPERWEAEFFGARNLTAELILPDLLSDCAANPVVALRSGATVDLRKACDALGRWDARDTPDSRGSALFAEFLRNLDAIPMTGFALESRLWKRPFDPAEPIGTPSGLQTGPETREALALAVQKFDAAKVAIDAPLRDVQSVTRNGVRMPISGSGFAYHLVRPGAFEVGKGITEIRTGDSYIHAVSLLPAGPKGRFIVTYSQSTNASSPHYADMTEVYSRQELLDIPFSEEEVVAAQVGGTEHFSTGQLARPVHSASNASEGDTR